MPEEVGFGEQVVSAPPGAEAVLPRQFDHAAVGEAEALCGFVGGVDPLEAHRWCLQFCPNGGKVESGTCLERAFYGPLERWFSVIHAEPSLAPGL